MFRHSESSLVFVVKLSPQWIVFQGPVRTGVVTVGGYIILGIISLEYDLWFTWDGFEAQEAILILATVPNIPIGTSII